MQNPFETGHIKNYILAYVSVVVIMVLFFIASSLFHDVEKMEQKTFNTEVVEVVETQEKEAVEEKDSSYGIKLMDKAY